MGNRRTRVPLEPDTLSTMPSQVKIKLIWTVSGR
jgi:hypothetical protein